MKIFKADTVQHLEDACREERDHLVWNCSNGWASPAAQLHGPQCLSGAGSHSVVLKAAG